VIDETRPPAVSVEGLRAGYGAVDVLKGLSVEFQRGEVFVLLGPNGAGKSTLVRVLTGALRPRDGQVRFADARGAVGLAPQQVALYPWLSPSENCIAFGRLSGLSRGECAARLGSVMRLTGCEPVAQTPVARLSGGYQRRANIAAALMNEPKLLILDEPTAGLDAEGRGHVAAVTRALRDAGAALLLVTHDFEFAEGLADRVGVLLAGRFVCIGSPARLVASRFNSSYRVEIVLNEAPDDAGRNRLAALGAEPHREGRAIRLWRPLASFDAAHVARDIEAAGFRPLEMRVRPPGLEDLFAAVLAEEAGA
jgi:ABC-2 type transport system ATP-binding protein